jgi:hypothetical protein
MRKPEERDERQEEHDRPENLVQPEHLDVKPAASLQEEANSNNSLDGYAAMNVLSNDEIAKEVEELDRQKKR